MLRLWRQNKKRHQEGTMPGDPKECRLHAFRCAELAASARTPQVKSTLLELSANWQKLAGDLEATHALLAEEAIASPPHPSEAARVSAVA
jgi:hypothetical protein